MRIPAWTLLLCSIATVVFFLPSIGTILIYDRKSILGGEWWRLITGNFVHYTVAHLTFDVAALLVVGTILEQQCNRYLWLVYFTAGTAIGLVVYFVLPELRYYGGLSGIVTAAIVYLCMSGINKLCDLRWLYLSVLVLVAIKIGVEFSSGTSLLVSMESQPFVSVPESHLAGACTAFLVYLLIGSQGQRRT